MQHTPKQSMVPKRKLQSTAGGKCRASFLGLAYFAKLTA